ncbi:hypothetical protein [Polaromonas jejuensis]|uniref:DUF2062 domain-containing protein n=1 Tax=Polaromonas jejuensis TaxID=457502 RepID=A0ABW0QEB8_9BURK|nr:hypothetical protein [Polaromonas jejuensis]
MKWPLVFKLSLFGLAMGLLTVFVIPSNAEPFFWLAIFVLCAYIIARRCSSRHFIHGLSVSLLNSVWITAAHVIFFAPYMSSHAKEAAMLASMPLPDSPRLMMVMMGPLIGLASGIVLGLFALIASKFVKPGAAAPGKP